MRRVIVVIVLSVAHYMSAINYLTTLRAYLAYRNEATSAITRRFIDSDYDDYISIEDKPKPSSNGGCGGSNFNPLGRIVGGKKARPGNWPWAVALGYQNEEGDTRYRCGGTLITDKHVLTAAHCIQLPPDEPFQLKGVLLGITDLRKGNIDSFKLIERVDVHNEYNPESHENDIALIMLQEPLVFNAFLRAVCMPPPDGVLVGRQIAYVAGWGATHFGGSGPAVLQYTELPLLNASLCANAYFKLKQAIDSKIICAGFTDGSKDACQGDSGGGLVLRHGVKYHIIGVVSFGYECAKKGYPGVYMRVANYTNWIDKVISAQLKIT